MLSQGCVRFISCYSKMRHWYLRKVGHLLPRYIFIILSQGHCLQIVIFKVSLSSTQGYMHNVHLAFLWHEK